MNNTNKSHPKSKQVNYKLLFFHLKESKYYSLALSGIIIVLCLLLTVFVVVPLGENLFSVNAAADQDRQRIAMLNQNVNYLSLLSDSDVQQKVLLSNALFPKTKDFNGAIQAVNAAATSANVTIQNFSFSVGELNGKKPTASGSTDMQMKVSVIGTVQSFASFLQALETKVPLMDVQNIVIQANTATLLIQVAYQPYVARKVDLTTTLLSPSSSTESLLQKAVEWQSESEVTASPSASATVNNLPAF